MQNDRETYDLRTFKLAAQVAEGLPHDEAVKIYECLRRAVYGLPANAVDARKLVHCLAEWLSQGDPSE
jgi:hypothetical protein